MLDHKERFRGAGKSHVLAPHETLVIGKPVSAVISDDFDDLDGGEYAAVEEVRRSHGEFATS